MLFLERITEKKMLTKVIMGLRNDNFSLKTRFVIIYVQSPPTILLENHHFGLYILYCSERLGTSSLLLGSLFSIFLDCIVFIKPSLLILMGLGGLFLHALFLNVHLEFPFFFQVIFGDLEGAG